MNPIDNMILNTNVLPKWNCNNCKYFRRNKEVIETKSVGMYAMECGNVTHPLEDCVMRGFEAHSEQPGFSQTLNK